MQRGINRVVTVSIHATPASPSLDPCHSYTLLSWACRAVPLQHPRVPLGIPWALQRDSEVMTNVVGGIVESYLDMLSLNLTTYVAAGLLRQPTSLACTNGPWTNMLSESEFKSTY